MGGSLTVSERILFHLNSFIRYEDKYEVPFHLTQDGISRSCKISRAHAAIELKKLRESGLVDERLSHVRKGKTRRKVYLLTHDGKARASAISQYVSENGIDTMVDASSVPADASSSGERKRCRRSSPMPGIRYFYGRKQELAELKAALADPARRLLVLKGIPGIGKTTLAVKLLSEATDQRVFWHSVKPWDAPRNIAESLGDFFARNGNRRLEAYLASGSYSLGEMSYLLREMLSENGYVFAFDDADASEDVQEFLLMFRHSSGAGKILVTVEGGAAFYEKSEVVARQEVTELELGGLDPASAIALLKTRGIDEDVGKGLVSMVKGHPLSLEMVTESTETGARSQLSRFLEEKFYDGLSPEQRSLLQLASVFQKPFPAEAIPRGLRGARKASMLRETAPDRFEIHASLRDFVYDHMSAEDRSRWHSVAADHYLRAGEPIERLVHLLKANRTLEAEMLMARMQDLSLSRGDAARLWQALRGFEPSRLRYRSGVTLARARLADALDEPRTAWDLLEGLSRHEDPGVRAEAITEMGIIRSDQGRPEEARELFEDAVRLASDDSIRARALRGLGEVQWQKGSLAEAAELFDRSAKDSLAAMDQEGVRRAQLALGGVLMARGDYREAVEHFSICATGLPAVDLAGAYLSMGIAYARMHREGDAIRQLRNAVQLSADTGQSRIRAYAHSSLAETLTRSGRVGEGREHCFEAIEIFTELEDRLGVSAAYANLAMAELSAGDETASEESFAECLRVLEEIELPSDLSEAKPRRDRGPGGREGVESALKLINDAIRRSVSAPSEPATPAFAASTTASD
ncbi:MAG: tetratricopeptide repeat protein [Methanobacteriota archaeon]|nr:MAG: tetratricopeptide repeat protein [Euryarchaeota archaeon]